jgi:hypothetical protein
MNSPAIVLVLLVFTASCTSMSSSSALRSHAAANGEKVDRASEFNLRVIYTASVCVEVLSVSHSHTLSSEYVCERRCAPIFLQLTFLLPPLPLSFLSHRHDHNTYR